MKKFAFPKVGGSITAVAFQANGPHVALASADRHVRVWHLAKRQLVTTLRAYDIPQATMFSSDGQRLFVVSSSKESDYGGSRIEIWDTFDWTQSLSIAHNEKSIQAAALGDDIPRLITISKDLRVWDVIPWDKGDFADDRKPSRNDNWLDFMNEQTAKLVHTGSSALPASTNSRLTPFRYPRNEWPRRSATAPTSTIDLTDYYNARIDLPWGVWTVTQARTQPIPENNIAALPRGIVTLGGITFDVRGLIQLAPSSQQYQGLGLFYPAQLAGVRINRHCSKLHFLHATRDAPCPSETPVGIYVLHYTDGSSEELPILYDRDLDDWHDWPTSGRPPTRAREVWRGESPQVGQRGGQVRVFLSTRENPKPKVEIATIDLRATEAACAPFVIAISVE
jgi:hypothetical protein